MFPHKPHSSVWSLLTEKVIHLQILSGQYNIRGGRRISADVGGGQRDEHSSGEM